MSYPSYISLSLCGCWSLAPNSFQKQYLPQVALRSHTTILATTSRTILRQTFINPANSTLPEVQYTFPLYDGVGVAGFTCTVAGRTIVGIVKERNQARADYDDAVSRGQTAGLLEQNSNAADVFTTSIGNVPAGENVVVEITYLGELKNDAETDGVRYTIPTQIAPRYGNMIPSVNTGALPVANGGINITVDIALEEGVAIRGIQSPSHPIAVTLGRTSTTEDEDTFDSNMGSSTLSLGSSQLDRDFVVVIMSKGQDAPRAMLETHPTLPNQRALMTTLVSKFNLPNEHPEVVFIVDRSGSMGGKMHLVIEALHVFLKSLPVSVKFNICSFGSRHSFLFEKSRTYDAKSLQTAMDYIQPGRFGADFGGTEMLSPIQDVLKRRYSDLPLEAMLLTDGEVWNQDALFAAVSEASQHRARFFTLGIGSAASSSLVEGIARAGRGFSQWVNDGERIDKRIVRMLKGALTPHINYKLEIKYASSKSADEEDFEIIESFEKSMKLFSTDSSESVSKATGHSPPKRKISLFSPKIEDEPTNPEAGKYDHLPLVPIPKVLQTPHEIPGLYPHSRSTIYFLLGPGAPERLPTSVMLRGKSEHGDLELEIPVQDIGIGTSLHQLAAKKAMQELEEGRGWLTEALDADGRSLKSHHEGKWDLVVEREAARVGTTFQVAGKFCSFVAIEPGQEDKSTPQTSHLQPYQLALKQLEQQKKPRKLMAGTSSVIQRCGASLGSRKPAFGGVAPGAARSGQADSCYSPSKQSDRYRDRDRDRGFSDRRDLRSTGPGTSIACSIAPSPPPCHQGAQAINPAAMMFSAASPVSALSSNDMQYQGAQRLQMGAQQQQQAQFHSYGSPQPQAPFAESQIQTPSNLMGLSSLQSAPLRGMPLFSTRTLSGAAASRKSLPTGRPSMAKRTQQGQMAFSESCPDQEMQEAGSGQEIDALSALEKMHTLIGLQTFLGFWPVSEVLLKIVSHGTSVNSLPIIGIIDNLKGRCHGKVGGIVIGDLPAENFSTALAVAWLEVVMKDEEDVWEMVVGKAKGWLERQVGNREVMESIVEAAKGLW